MTMKSDRAITIEFLKTFLVLVENHSFSRTAEEIGRSQSAVSLQIKRLEEIAGTPILTSSGKSLSLTQQGTILYEYAKQIVDLNDECINRLDGNILSGTIRIGIPSDFAIAFLPMILGRFTETHPNISLDVQCELSASLTQKIETQECDIVVALDDGRPTRYLKSLWRDPVSWIGWQSHKVHRKLPLPLVLFPEPCQYRERVVRTLAGLKIPYKIVFSSSSMAGNHAAIQSGLGITALSRNSIPPYFHELPKSRNLPALDKVHVGIYWNTRGSTKATLELASFLSQVLDRKLEKISKDSRITSEADD